jgi:hypothetical protein
MQYGKLIGYWSCKITNTSNIAAVQCDCEKILTGTTGNDDDNFLARGQTTEKVDEWFNPFVSLGVLPKYFNITGTFFPHISSSSLSGVPGCVFQPPKFS